MSDAIKSRETSLHLRDARHIKHAYEMRPHKDKCRFDLISDALLFGALWYTTPHECYQLVAILIAGHIVP
jgi:hypothetical protein